jgi:hypothetical protein
MCVCAGERKGGREGDLQIGRSEGWYVGSPLGPAEGTLATTHIIKNLKLQLKQ